MKIEEIRSALPSKDREYELDIVTRAMRFSNEKHVSTKHSFPNSYKGRKSFLLLGCVFARAELSGTYKHFGFHSIHNFLNNIDEIKLVTINETIGLYKALAVKRFTSREMDNIDGQIKNIGQVKKLRRSIVSVKSKAEADNIIDAALNPQSQNLQRKSLDNRKHPSIIDRLSKSYSYGTMKVDFRTADLLLTTQRYLESLSARGAEIEIVKCLAVKALIERPTNIQCMAWCNEYNVRPIFAALLSQWLKGELSTHYLSILKVLSTNPRRIRRSPEPEVANAIQTMLDRCSEE